LKPEQKTLVSLLAENKEMHIDQIALYSEMKVSKVAALLLEMEFAGIIKALPGKQFKLI
ncbi:MAG: DNA-protecting protein DprA, partial [Bacteroidia bacterium]|nr:DNA-protecting protein DprA [Bacteroidia bacterium]